MENFKKLGKANLTPAKIRQRITSLKDVWSQYQEGHDLLTRQIPSNQQASLDYFRNDYCNQTEEHFHLAMDFMAECLEELEPVVSPNQSFTSPNVRLDTSAFSFKHLPPINLLPFVGTYDQWEAFRDGFTTLIIKNKDLNDFARMHFLTSCLNEGIRLHSKLVGYLG